MTPLFDITGFVIVVSRFFQCTAEYNEDELEVSAMTIYIDRILTLNALVNYLLLSTTARMCGDVASQLRRCLAAGLGACYALVVLLPGGHFWGMLSLKLLCAGGMVLVCFGRRRMLRNWLLLLAVSALYGGAVLALETLLGGSVTVLGGVAYYPVHFPALIGTGVALWLLFSTVLTRLGGHSGGDLATLTLTLEGRTVTCTALRDTGNTLCDPVSGYPVPVVDWQTLHQLLPNAPPDLPEDPVAAMALLHARGRLLPCKTVSGTGLLPALRCDRVSIDGTRQAGTIVAVAAGSVSDGGAYHALIGGT